MQAHTHSPARISAPPCTPTHTLPCTPLHTILSHLLQISTNINNSLQLLQCLFTNIYKYPQYHTTTVTLQYCAYPKCVCWAQPLLGLTIYLYCGLWVSCNGWSYTQQTKYTPVSSNSSLCLIELLTLFLRMIALFSQCSLQNCQCLFPHSLPLFIG